MARFAMDWAPPRVLDFCKAAEELLEADGPAQVQKLQNDFRKLFSDYSVMRELVNAYLQRVLDGKVNNGDAVIGNDTLIITYSPTLTVRILKDRNDMFAFNQTPTSNVLMNYPSNSLVLEARRRFPVMPTRAGDTFTILSSATVNAQIVTFDANTLRPVGASMSSDTNSAVCVMLGLVQPDQPDYPLDEVVELTRHPDHHVRWAAVTALGRHNRDVTLDIIAQLKERDPHKFIRDAARLTLQRCVEAA